ncbi:GntR family transcriptional regulator [Peribacillus frigoritolerans]|uniref:GntR family transcriptional regulator n=1 Tax=Peribacillus frigoritolerans TaxID=450367 RepID=UPI0007BFCD72|nr:GntR family transcriptional regulator [Peribacillus frigoritolerans]MBD8133927.1 GntR family transcriptional regulator [Bacillus sp. CFBP 13597]MCR8869815.1 GntR family transcriptional regulator [Peribacillus frigoritolerans]MDG4850873.1 GntR family transcriptional regulator [Peribacillus frigoritolerans]MED4695914.1 GntR family transcriptional regulator [Peribacillus frigoritolerans]
MTVNLKLNTQDLETIPVKICRVIREAIIKGDFQPGERLIQDELAKSLGVSRMPIREAIKQLEAEGYVTLEPHKGAIVREFSVKEIEEIYFLRSKFEPLVVKESLKFINTNIIQQLENLIEEMNQTKEVSKFIELNIVFHNLLIKDCPWEKLNSFIKNLWTGFPQQTPHLLPDQIEVSKQEHKAMIEAIKVGNDQLVCEIMERHIIRAGNQVLENIKNK